MSSWIGVYGHSKNDRIWMRRNHQRADQQFKEIHPVYEDGGERFEHSILVNNHPDSQNPRHSYYWEIPCHWDSSEHFKQTEADIRTILAELGSPKGLEVYLSPMAD
ncbi:hypothetical protein HYT24_03165 [Candidatus Pacearchaeota archaeon]|nr:hypothetical protein [Candidatus Pacearchaeota archaeon]